MILIRSQRGGGAQLAAHLLRTDYNYHVEIHDLSGFVVDDLGGAFKEAYAVSRGTRCRQFLISLSLNPPEEENVPIAIFEDAISQIKKRMGLSGQPRAIVFHEKEDRRHAHCVWSCIKADDMKAINLPHFKVKLRDVSREKYFEHGWKLPNGLVNSEARNPLNFTQHEWPQSERLNAIPERSKTCFGNVGQYRIPVRLLLRRWKRVAIFWPKLIVAAMSQWIGGVKFIRFQGGWASGPKRQELASVNQKTSHQ